MRPSIISRPPMGSSACSPGGALVPLGSYVNMDARIAYRVNDRVTLALSGDNLLQDRQRQNIGPEIERRVLVSLAVSL